MHATCAVLETALRNDAARADTDTQRLECEPQIVVPIVHCAERTAGPWSKVDRKHQEEKSTVEFVQRVLQMHCGAKVESEFSFQQTFRPPGR
jgi:hypothetical protein